MNIDSLLTRDAGTLSTKIDGEAVLMNVESGKYFNLDHVGCTIWESLENPITLEKLQTQLIEKFDGEEATIRSESKTYIEDLITRGLVTTSS